MGARGRFEGGGDRGRFDGGDRGRFDGGGDRRGGGRFDEPRNDRKWSSSNGGGRFDEPRSDRKWTSSSNGGRQGYSDRDRMDSFQHSKANNICLRLAPGTAVRPSLELTTNLVEYCKRSLSHANISDQAMRDITSSVGTLASYGLLGSADDNTTDSKRSGNWSY